MSLKPSVVLTKRRKAIYGMAAFCLLSVVAVGAIAAYEWLPQPAVLSLIENVPDLATPASAQTETPQSPEPPPSPDRVSVELVTLTARGFERREITRPAGRFLIVVVNKSENPDMTLRLERENGTVLDQVQMPRNRRRWRLPVTLTPGRYKLIDTTRAGQVCNIEITR